MRRAVANRNGRINFPDLENRHELWRLLVVITSHKAVDRQRAAKAQKRGGLQVRGDSVFQQGGESSASPGFDRFGAPDPTPEFLAALADEHQRLLSALDDDTERQIALWKMEGLLNEEIAQRLGVTRRSVQRKLQRIRLVWSEELNS